MPDPMLRGDALSPRVKSVVPKEDYTLLLSFSNGERRLFDAKPLLSYPVFKALRDPGFFRLVQTAYGSIAWPNDIDYCPDTLYAESLPVGDTEVSHA